MIAKMMSCLAGYDGNTVFYGVQNKIRGVMHVQLFYDIIPVGIDGTDTDVQDIGYLLMVLPFGDKLKYFTFPIG